MDKLKMQSLDVVGSNIKKIQQLFPNCVTERLNKDGKPELAIDFEKLQAELSNEIIVEGEERYQFTWPDKRAANRLANTPTTMTLRPCREESVDFDHTQNLYIEGDNLDVLKALRETYLGKVKMIYIDPPYNTGNDFVYNDDFAQSRGDFEETSGLFDEEGNQTIDLMQRNTERNGRFHTDWLNMIYPRLKIAKDLLSDDGVIFISIDDNEVENLKRVCSEVMGERNFISQIIWKKRSTPPNDKVIGAAHEYVLCYSKNNLLVKLNLRERTDKQLQRYQNPDNHPKGPWTPGDLGANIKGGRYVASLFFPIVNPNTGEAHYPPQNGNWRFNKQTIADLLNNNEIYFGADGKGRPKLKRFLCDVKDGIAYTSLWDFLPFNTQGSKEMTDLLGNIAIFDNPKPIDFIKELVKLGSDTQCIIMDFFSGSATTAHAVMQLNAEDGGNRKFIMVQLPEKTDEKSEAYKAGYPNICEIGKERIRRAGKKIKEDNKDKEGIEKLDTGFRVLKLDSSNMEDVYYTPQEFTMQSLFNENVKADRTGEDLLFQVMLDLGIELSAKIETQQIAGKTVYLVDDNYLVACFDRDVTEAVVTEIAKLHPIYFVMRDASAANDNVIDNFEQLFEAYSKDTVRKIL